MYHNVQWNKTLYHLITVLHREATIVIRQMKMLWEGRVLRRQRAWHWQHVMSLSLLNAVAQLAVAQSVCRPDDSTPFSLHFHILLLIVLFYLVRVGLSRSGEKYNRWLAKRAKRVWSGACRSLTSTSCSWVSPAKWKICSRTTTWTKSETPATERLPSTSGFILFSLLVTTAPPFPRTPRRYRNHIIIIVVIN